MFDNKSTRIKTQAPTPVDELFFCPVTVCIDIWLRLSSYKQLVFHIYLHRFNILKIVTFNKLPCFVQPKSSNASVFFSSMKLQSRSTHGFCHFIKCTIHLFHHHRHKYHYYQKKIPRICYVITINRAIGCQSCRSAVSRHIVFCS